MTAIRTGFIAQMFAGSQQKGPNPEVGLGMGIDRLGWIGLLTDRLHIAHAPVRLKGHGGEVCPGFFYHRLISAAV